MFPSKPPKHCVLSLRQRTCIAFLLLSLVFAWPSLASAEECEVPAGASDPCQAGELLRASHFLVERESLDRANAAAERNRQLQRDIERCVEQVAKAEDEKEGPGWGTVAMFGTSMAAVGFAIGMFVGAGL